MRRLLPVILAMVLAPIAASAESPKHSWENLKQLQPGHKIKVVDVKFKAWSGKLVSVSDEAIMLQEERKQQEITVERANVFRVTDMQRSKRARNALIGLLAGALLVPIAGGESSDDADTAVGAVITSGIGAGIGALFPGPRPTLFRAQKPPPPGGDRPK